MFRCPVCQIRRVTACNCTNYPTTHAHVIVFPIRLIMRTRQIRKPQTTCNTSTFGPALKICFVIYSGNKLKFGTHAERFGRIWLNLYFTYNRGCGFKRSGGICDAPEEEFSVGFVIESMSIAKGDCLVGRPTPDRQIKITQQFGYLSHFLPFWDKIDYGINIVKEKASSI